MTIYGVDYSLARPSPAALAKAGKVFACRYLSLSTNGKNLTHAEADALSRAGVAVVSNWEWSAGDARKGYAAGRAYATEALKQATACGMPAGRPIYISVDFAPSAADWPAISEYFRGARSVLGLAGTGIYGGYDTIAKAYTNGWASWFWQTYAWSTGSQVGMPTGVTKWHPAAHIQQYHNGVTLAGADLDLDRAMKPDYGQWTTGTAPAQEVPDMNTQQDNALAEAWAADKALRDGIDVPPAGNYAGGKHWGVEALRAQTERLDKLAAAVTDLTAQQSQGIDYDKLAAALLRTIAANPAS